MKMDPIPKIEIQNTQVRVLNIPDIGIWNHGIRHPYNPIVPVVVNIGKPIVDMPGCVEVHELNETGIAGSKNKSLSEDDEPMTFCDGQMPHFDAMNYEPEQLVITYEQKAPDVIPPPEPPGSPETPDTGSVAVEEVPCPGPNQPRIGTLGPNEKEKVSGYELQKDPVNPGKEICVILYEDIGAVEQYLPSAQVASTTAVIATVAGASALLAKPLADLLLRVFRPAIKTALTKVNAILGKTPYRPTQDELKTNEYRKKKGLNPIPFAKNHAKRLKKEEKK